MTKAVFAGSRQRTMPDYVPLGALRFLLAFLVFAGHALAAPELLGAEQGLGLQTCGVAVFFMVSGYVILSAYTHFYRAAPGRFLANRALRIFPPFWAVYLITLAVYWLIDPVRVAHIVTLKEFLGNMSLMGAYLQISALKFISHAWTLQVEFQFYLVAIGFLCVVGRFVDDGKLTWAFLVTAIAAYGFVLVTHGHYRFYGGAQYAPFFGLGAAIYAFHAGLIGRRAGLAVILFLLALSDHEYAHYLDTNWPENALRVPAHLVFLAVAVLCFFLAGRTATGRVARWDRKAGDLTYHLYLCHLPVLQVLTYLNLAHGWGGLLVRTGLSVALAVVFYVLADLPIRKIRDHVRGRVLEAA